MSPVSQAAVKAPAVTADAFDAPGIDDIAFSLVAALRRHPHLSNVLTHISRSNWPRVEQTLRVILDPATQRHDLTPLAHNILDLMVAERGVTGRIFKPYLHALLVASVGANRAETLLSLIHRLTTQPPPKRALQLIADHDSRPPRAQLKSRHGARRQGVRPKHGPDT
ncbi:MAG: hypothetical protein M9932_06690 [Xanthobacteraceae bacterium]|nr:hypothetical protein [Xanthobacteraceae bacterium]